MAQVLFVSKALAPPWNDSGKNLVRDLARSLRRHTPTVMGVEPLPELAHVGFLNVYAERVGFAPGLRDQARVFSALLRARRHDIWHFFFAPNPKSCLAGGAACKLRRKRALHTIASAPRDPERMARLLFADRNVVLSRHTEQRLRAAGLAADRVVRIPPAIEPLTPKSEAERSALRRELTLPDGPILLYPGDLEFGEGAHVMLELARAARGRGSWTILLACRAKTERAREAERALRERASQQGLNERVQFIGETARIHDYLAAADVVLLPSRDLYAKMDYPLVLLEAMSLERPVIVATDSAAAELAEGGGARALPLDVDALVHEVERLLDDGERRSELGRAARHIACERYHPRVMAEAYERAYDELLGH